MSTSSTLNLGILAHVDAGKTSLTERLLHAAGVIDEIGSVDHGNTQTDSLDLERRRGITIKSAVVSFAIDDVTVNLIDTPGHPDFIAEVERVLSVLDGAVLVVSAVEGVQPQTRVLMRTLRRLGIPTLIFVNKIDRGGARYDGVLAEMSSKLVPQVVAMGTTAGLGTRSATFTPYDDDDTGFRARLVDLLTGNDDALMEAFVDDEATVSNGRLRRVLAVQTARTLVHPVYFGSAITGAGVPELTRGIKELLPKATGSADAPPAGTVFKVERGPAGEKIAYARMFTGTVQIRDRIDFGAAHNGKVTAISVFHDGGSVDRTEVGAGQIAKLWGLPEVRIGDAIGAAGSSADSHYFAPPSLETVVFPCRPRQKGVLRDALGQLAEQDPLIDLRQDDIRQEIYVSLYGEVQKEVIEATLATEYGVEVGFRETTTICIERPNATGAAFEIGDQNGNPFLATIGLRIEPAPIGSGVSYGIEIEPGSLPLAFQTAIEETVGTALQQGLNGWQVTDCTVTLYRSGYWPRQSKMHAKFDKSMSSTAGDFRNLTPLVLMAALREAGTTVLEPMHRFRLELPADLLGAVLTTLGGLKAVPQTPAAVGTSYVLEGFIPAARVHELELQLPSLTRGEGVLETGFDHYEPVRGARPSRARTDQNPLDRKEYLLHVQRRV